MRSITRLNKGVRFWSVSDDKEIRTLNGHKFDVSSGAFSSDGQMLAQGSEDGTVRLWRTSDGSLMRSQKGRDGEVGRENIRKRT